MIDNLAVEVEINLESLTYGLTETMSVDELESFVKNLNNVISNPIFTKHMRDYFIEECVRDDLYGV